MTTTPRAKSPNRPRTCASRSASPATTRIFRRASAREEKRNWIFQRFVKDHHRAVYGVDENLGRVLEFLDTSGLAEDTLIIYTTDNGYFLGEHGWYDKRFMYEPSLRMPLLLRYPRLVTPERVEPHMALNVDIAPTILDFAGVPRSRANARPQPAPAARGRPARRLAPVGASTPTTKTPGRWPGNGAEARSDPSFQYFTPHRIGPHRGVRTARHKLIEYYGEGDYWELFDLEQDPHEVRNLYGQPGQQDLTAS